MVDEAGDRPGENAGRDRADGDTRPADGDGPSVAACASCPGRAVFIEDGNTDGWIASDLTVDVTR
ncbi:MAG: hypothetical protein ABEJ42_01465 [Halobacteriaceae archaeon]